MKKELMIKSLVELQNGKATESIQIRLNEREFEILNKAFSYCSGNRSRHAWLVKIVMSEARSVLNDNGIIINPKTNLISKK